MIKIWGKIVTGDKVINSKTIDVDTKKTSFFDMLKTLTNKLNIPTPVLLDKHVNDFNVFNICFFKPDDFIEVVHFDKLILQYLPE